MPISTVLKLKYATGFELHSRWVPLKINKKVPGVY